MDYYDPGAGRCGRYGSCSTRVSAPSAAGRWEMYGIARTVQSSWKRCAASPASGWTRRSTISAIWPVRLRPTVTTAVCGAAS
ncbi:MAG: hypothetical protein ACLVJH_02970 [Faecalibacterium prausnitzii]